jgi:cardiolipin synthase
VPPSDTTQVPASSDLDRILTVPNVLTLGRLLCLPVFLWLLFVREDEVAAAVLLAVLGATDWCDGYVARRYHQESNFGRLFDPTVDRVLFLVAVGGIVIHGSAPWWFCLLVLVREVTVSIVSVTLAALGAEPVRVTWFGKAGTFLLMFAFPWFLAASSDLRTAPVFAALAWLVGVPGLVLSYYAAFRYVPEWRANLAVARARRRAAANLPST